MDPRPYHFDYRRPRPSNPTLYCSLTQPFPLNFRPHPAETTIPFQNEPRTVPPFKYRKRANSTELKSSKVSELSSLLPNPSRGSVASSQKGKQYQMQ